MLALDTGCPAMASAAWSTELPELLDTIGARARLQLSGDHGKNTAVRTGVGRRHAESLAAQGAVERDDLFHITAHDCRNLGFSIGERNRMLKWAVRQSAGALARYGA
jgi:hypothetical protein